MAQISGYIPGLTPKTLKASPKPKAEPEKLEPMLCVSCGGELPKRTPKRSRHVTNAERQCTHCSSFFGGDTSPFNKGCTDKSPEDCTKRIKEAKNSGWVMLLRTHSLGAPGNVTVQLQLGDIVKVSRATPEPGNGPVKLDRTRGMFMIDVTVGPVNVTLYPHEFSAIPFTTIMEMKRDGEVEEQFVSPDDETGYFAPTLEVREQIQNAFGNR